MMMYLPVQVQQLLSEATSLATKFQQESEAVYIDRAIVLDREALNLCRHSHPGRSTVLTQLASHLWRRYKLLGAIDDLDEAIRLDRDALPLHPSCDVNLSTSLSNLALHLSTRFSRLGGSDDLEEAIVLERDALALCPPGHPHRPVSLSNLGLHLSTRYKHLGVIDELDEAIIVERYALALRPSGHPDRLTSLNNLASFLSTRCIRIGQICDLDEAIALSRGALALCPPAHVDRLASLSNLALPLFIRYTQLGETDGLIEAIALERDLLVLLPPGHPDRSTSLSHLALYLSYQYKYLGETGLVNEAIVLEREALVLRPPGHPDRSTSLNNLALHLSSRYGQLGETNDLHEAIAFSRSTLVLCPQSHPDRLLCLSNLASHLSTRFDQLRGIDDLDEAIDLTCRALELCPPEHLARSICLGNLALYFSNRHIQLGGTDDLNEAIVLSRSALALSPPGHPDRSTCLNNLALHLSARYKQLKEIDDLDEAISLSREALALFTPEHLHRSLSISNLARHLSTRYIQLGGIDDLNTAISLARDALMHCPSGHPSRSPSLRSLAECLRVQFTKLGGIGIREELFDLYAQLQHVSHAVAPLDLSVAKEWVVAAEDFHHPTTLLAYETALRLLVQHSTSLPSLPQHLSVLKSLTSSLAVDAFSACLRNQSPEKAIEFLEQGRGIFWSQLSRLRSPLQDLIASGPNGKALADEFTRLTLLVRNVLRSPSADQHDRICNLNLELQKVISDIRELPGLSRFLLPPSFSDLQCAASGGPVIIVNASKYSCDALILFADKDPVHIPLQVTKEDVRQLSSNLGNLTKLMKSMDVTREFKILFRDLWDKVVTHVVDSLQMTRLPLSRIWWCPTAELSLLPLHAANPFRKGQKGFSDLYISSYTPTLTALIRARQSDSQNSATRDKHFIAIGQANAKGATALPSIGTELANIGQLVDSLAIFKRIEGADSHISNVADELGKNEWVHFACHGFADQKHPFESAFALHDGRFTIQHIIQSNLQNAEFAYLSACHTTVGDGECPDEMIHLASAMQFAGFRSVIGTMWSVADGETNKITSMFYRHMTNESGHLDHTRAAFALWKTMRSVKIPLDQRILYVHLGA